MLVNKKFLHRELVAELPFTLMHPKPDGYDRPESSTGSHKSEEVRENGGSGDAVDGGKSTATAKGAAHTDPPVDTNLIQLEP